MIEESSLLEKVLQAHVEFEAFRCRATLRRTIQADSVIESSFAMRLAFSRPGNLFLQWWLDDDREVKHRVVLSTGSLIIDHSFGDMEWKQPQSIEDVLAAHAGISSGLSLHVPSLLLGYKEYSLFESVEAIERRSDSACESYLITGVGGNAVKRIVQVRAADLVILRMTEQFAIANGRVVCESEYTDIKASSQAPDPTVCPAQ